MPGKDPIVPLKPQSGLGNVNPMVFSAPPIQPSGVDKTKYKAQTEFNDPFFSGGFEDAHTRDQMMQSALDEVQPWYDKLGNGFAKFGGTLSSSVISGVGTIWGLAGSPFKGFDYVWDNEVNKIGDDINNYVNENFRNYRSMEEQNASAWSLSHWMTLNFFADNILGNAGYAAGAYLTGMGMSTLLRGLTPLIARGALAEGLNIARTEGVEALKQFSKAYKYVNAYDKAQAGASALFSAMSEASTEALGAYNEFKQKKISELADKYGGEANIPQSELDRLDSDAKSMGNTVYGLNIPLLMASDLFQFGKSLMGFKSLTNQSARAETRIAMGEMFGNYAEQEAKTGFKNAALRTLKTLGTGVQNNMVEAGEEGAQFLISEGNKSYYGRKFDKKAAGTWDELADGYWQATKDLFNTQEGAANLIAGFATGGLMPYNYGHIRDAITNKTNKAATDYQLQNLNSLNVKETIKRGMESATRAASIQADLEQNIKEGNEFEARNDSHDLMKNYVQSRIQAGRYDLLEDEIDRMTKMSTDEFKQYFDIENVEADFDHKKLLNNYKETAKDMQKTWVMLERLFSPTLYRFNDKDDESRKAAVEQMNQYHEAAWSYLMDAKDADKRLKGLRIDVDQLFGGMVSLQNVFGDKVKDPYLNDLIKEYNAAAIEHKVNQELTPGFEDKVEAKYLKGLMKRIKGKVNKHVAENKESLGLPEYMAKGEPQFIEEYLFDIEKQLDNINGSAVFEKALLGGQGDLVDVRSTVAKLNDMRRLEKRRMLAVAAYNNLSTAVKEGKYTDIKVKNPNYKAGVPETIKVDGEEMPNPAYQPEFITNEELLRGDTYKQFADERDKYRDERRKKDAANQKEMADFNSKLEAMEGKNSRHEDARKFKATYNKYYHGDENNKGFKSMTDEELDAALKDMNREALTHQYSGTYRTDTKEARDNFDKDGYIDVKAKHKAFNQELNKRRAEHEAAIKKQATLLATQYEQIATEQGVEVAEEFYKTIVDRYKDNKDVLDIIQKELDAKRTEMGVVEEKVDPMATAQGTMDDEENAEDFFGPEKKGEEEEKPADISEKKVPVSIPTRYPSGVEPNNQKGGTSVSDEIELEKAIKEEFKPSDRYLIINRKDLEWQQVEDIYPVTTLDNIKVGARLMVDSNEGIVSNITGDKYSISLPGVREGGAVYTKDQLLQRAKEGKLQRVYPRRENVYDDAGNVIVNKKQFNGDLYDPKSDISLTPGRQIRLRRIKMDNGVPVVKLYVKKGDTNEYVPTDILYDLNPDKVASRFPDSSKVTSATIAGIQQEVARLAKELRNTDTVQAIISDDLTGFGKLVTNPGRAGQREGKGIGNAIGINFLNNGKVTGGAFIGVLDGDQVTGNDIKFKSSKTGTLMSLNNRPGVYVPSHLIDALTKNGNKAGQAVLALPTGKMDGGKQIHMPVLLNTRDMAEDLSQTHLREDGKQMSIGELLVDVLLNPGKVEYAQQMKMLFDMVGADWNNGQNPDYEGFYTKDNMFAIMNSVFFAGAIEKGAGENENKVRYSFPFFMNVSKTAKGNLYLEIDISKTAGTLTRTKKKVSVFLQNEDGSLNTKPVSERIAQYIAETPVTNKEGKPVNIDRNITYLEIQNNVRSKPYRVDMELAAKSAEESNPFEGIILDSEGNLTTKRYESYLHYMTDRNLLTTTVQPIRDGNRQFYFANAVIPYTVNYNAREEEVKPNVTRVRNAVTKEVVDPVINDKIADIERRRQEDLNDGWTTLTYEEINAKYDAELAALNTTPKKAGGLNIGGINNDFTPADGKNGSQAKTKEEKEQAKPAHPVASRLASWGKKGKGLIDFRLVDTVDQFTIDGLERDVPVISEQITQELIDMLMEDYAKANRSKSFNRKGLKIMLKERLQQRVKEKEAEYKKVVTTDQAYADIVFAQKESLRFALAHFDIDDIQNSKGWNGMTPEEHKANLNYGTKQDPKYFLGFFNLALNELFKSKIVDVTSHGKEMLDFEGKESLNYTARFDDNWSFKVDPRDTVGRFARVIMSRVPQQVFNEKGELVDDVGPLGLKRYMTYESVHKTLISFAKELRPTDVYDFVQSIPYTTETQNNAGLMGIYRLLQGIKAKDESAYIQAIHHLFNASLLQQANYLIVETTTEAGRNAEQKIYDGSRQMINDEILSLWSEGLRTRIQQGNFIRSFTVEEGGITRTQYGNKLINGHSMADHIIDLLDKAFALKSDEKYDAIADVYVNQLGFPLSGDRSVKGTAAVLKSWEKKDKNGRPVFNRYFNGIYEFNSLETLVRKTLVDNIAKKIEDGLSDDATKPSTFNVEEPLAASTTILNSYAKALKGQFQDVVNSTINDINNNNRYIYVSRNNISEMMLNAKDREYLFKVANSTFGKYMPGISDLFLKDVTGKYMGVEHVDEEAMKLFEDMKLDYAGGIVRNKYRKSEASDAKEAAWSLLALNLFQNDERLEKGKTRHGIGRYLMTFGDSSTAPYYTYQKQEFGINYSEDQRVTLMDEINGSRINNVREQLYNIFKSEVNRSAEAIAKFEKLSKSKKGNIEKELRKGFHYNKIGKNYVMGAGAGIYGFDEEIYKLMAGPDSPIFVVDDIATDLYKRDYRVIGMKKGIVDKKGNLNDAALKEIFDGLADDFINRLVDAKMAQLQPFMKNLLELEYHYDEKAKQWFLDNYNMPLFSPNAVKAMMNMAGNDKGKRITISKEGAEEPLAHQYRKQVNNQEGRQGFASEEELLKSNYAALLFKSMIVDHQVNHFLFSNTWHAFNMVDYANYQKDGKTSYKEWYDNYTKRMKGLVTPKQQSVTQKGDKVRVITFNDPTIRQLTTTATTEQVLNLKGAQKNIFNYLLSHTDLVVKDPKSGKYTFPSRIFGHQGESIFMLNQHLWTGKNADTKKFNDMLYSYMNAKVTDGNSYITLREYLYRKFKEGSIRNEKEFNELYRYYSNPNLSMSPEDFSSKLSLQGMKYVKSGAKFIGDEMHRIYGKDGEFVLFPALTKGTHFDDIREHLEELEGKLPGARPGIVLSPISAMKLGGHAAIDLFNDKGHYVDALKTATIDEWDRDVVGKQIQNPDKLKNEVTSASQANTNIHNNLPAYIRFGEDRFTFEYEVNKQSNDDIIDDAGTGVADNHRLQLARLNKDMRKMKGPEYKTRKGATNREVMRMKFRLTSELMRRDLLNLMRDWGLKHEVGGEDYHIALHNAGLTPGATMKDIVAVMNGEDKRRAGHAFAAYRLRNQVVMNKVDNFLSDIKAQLIQRKGLTPNNTYLLRKIDEVTNGMEIPVTFNPNNSHIQSVILSRINSVIQGRKLPGFSFVQMSSIGFGKKEVAGNKDLKGYTPKYDEQGNFVGVNAAEIAIPWRFTDKAGKLLNYDEYVNEDGTPKMEKWDKEMLQIVGLRVPNTGPNTMGFFKVAKFLRGYKDVAQVPMEIVAQMNSDFDFDKLVTYIYRHKVENGKINKVKGFMSENQNNVNELFDNPEVTKKAIQHTLENNDPTYVTNLNNMMEVMDGKIKANATDILEYENGQRSEDEDAYTVEDLLNKTRDEKLEMLYRLDINEDDMADLQELMFKVEQAEDKAKDNFDMETFINETPDALQVLQTNEQLENALIDSYHMMLQNTELQRQMLTPLTTDWMKDQVDSDSYSGQSLRSVKEGNNFISPNAEVTKTITRASSTGADQLIGIMANFQKFQHIAQHADLALPEGEPIFFGDKNGNIITEEAYDETLFAIGKKAFTETAKQVVMTYRDKSGKLHNVPFRLGRLMGRDANGRLVSVAEAGAATLQAALDNLNDPMLGVAGLVAEAANEFELMLSLGYIDHAVPFINQPIIRDYLELQAGKKDVISDEDFNQSMEDLIFSYMDLAGMDKDAIIKRAAELSDDMGYRPLLQAATENMDKAFTVQQLKENVAMPEEHRDTSYYADQLWALELMARMKPKAQATFEIQQAVNVDAKGLADTTIIGADDQLVKYNKVKEMSEPKNDDPIRLLNAHKVTDNRTQIFTSNAAKRFGLDPVRDIFQYGKDFGMFQDLKATFKQLRDIGTKFNKKGDRLETKKQLNIGIIQFMLSDPSLYQDLISDFMEKVPASAHEVREFLMKEKYATEQSEDGKTIINLKENAATTLAGLLQKISNEKHSDETGETAYREMFDILDNLRPIVQQNNDAPSVAPYMNANNYKQRLDILLPQSIVRMMRDENPEVQKLARMLIVYPFMNGGTNNPISYLTHVPQEILFQYGFGSKLRAKMQELNNGFEALKSEFENKSEGVEDSRSYLEKLWSGDYTPKTTSVLNTMKAFITQYYQHQMFDLRSDYVVKADKIENEEDLDHVEFNLENYPPMLAILGKDRKGSRFFVNNGDGTYKQVDRLGYKYNVNEYSFNDKGQAGRTVVGMSQVGYDPTEVKINSIVHTADLKKGLELPYRIQGKGPVRSNYQSTMSETMGWVKNHAEVTMALNMENEAVVRIQKGVIALVDFLMPRIPSNVAMRIDSKMKYKGFAAFDKNTGMPTEVLYNHTQVDQNKEKEDSDFKYTMIHEAVHVAGGRSIALIEQVLGNKMDAKVAAKALSVTATQFKDMVKGYESLKALVNEKNFNGRGESFRQSLVKELQFVKMQDAGYDYSRTTTNAANLEAEAANQVNYAVGDIEEFMAITLQDGQFRKALNNLDYYVTEKEKKKGIWERIMDMFAQLLGIRENSVLEHAFYNTMRILDPVKAVTAKNVDKGKVQSRLSAPKEDMNAESDEDDIDFFFGNGKGLISFVNGDHFDASLKEVVPFNVDLQEAAKRFNFKQLSC